ADLLTSNEIEALIRACSPRAATGSRNRALIALLWRSGLRISEALDLRIKDINLRDGTVVVQHGKGDRRRVVGIDPGTSSLLERWLTVRDRKPIPRGGRMCRGRYRP